MSPSDRVSDAGGLMHKEPAQMSTLRAALIAGEHSGDAEPFDFDEFIAGKRR